MKDTIKIALLAIIAGTLIIQTIGQRSGTDRFIAVDGQQFDNGRTGGGIAAIGQRVE
jgi:hypothetical protein